MERRDFLKRLWQQLFIPLIFLSVIYYCVTFLVSIFYENGPERFSTILILSVIIFLTIVYLIIELLKKIKERFYAILSDKTIFYLRIISKIIDYFATLILGVGFYMLWVKDAILASVLMILFIIKVGNEIINEEKLNILDTNQKY